MARILVDLPDDDIRWLDHAAAGQNVSRAALLREAVHTYRDRTASAGIERFFGIWQDRSAPRDEDAQ
ncbi:ribbon-helix-helix protein, CopG family [Altererythrobacter aerius]|uniref:Ribbon-helix-helix protein, CopG family n=1 Tax=Tsuneonella aeria TaxID=1837929 RepID=A0A6I4TFQ4_9SPHN|nr:ribbon-helix-helix domain-containing protein [Tsuneonella aeria]MXO74930.1 ribbon-helix-helix protein, CopG family [Tsuneonella aeria]